MLTLARNFKMMAGALALALAAPVAQAETELSLATFIPPQHPMNAKVFGPWAEELGVLTNSDLTIRIYPSGELGSGPQRQYNRVVTGVADIAFGIPGYTSSQFPRTLVAELPGIFESPMDAVDTLWANFDLIADDYAQTKVLAIWVNSESILLTRDRPIKTLEDMKGLNIRAPSAVGAQVLEAWGANAVTMPVSEVYNAMQTGVVDGVFIGADAVRSFKLHEVSEYATFNLPTAVTAFYLLMNADSWDGLSDTQKEQLDKHAGLGISQKATETYVAAGAAARKLLDEKEGYTVTELAADERARWTDKLSDLYQHVAADLGEQGIDGDAVISGLQAD